MGSAGRVYEEPITHGGSNAAHTRIGTLLSGVREQIRRKLNGRVSTPTPYPPTLVRNRSIRLRRSCPGDNAMNAERPAPAVLFLQGGGCSSIDVPGASASAASPFSARPRHSLTVAREPGTRVVRAVERRRPSILGAPMPGPRSPIVGLPDRSGRFKCSPADSRAGRCRLSVHGVERVLRGMPRSTERLPDRPHTITRSFVGAAISRPLSAPASGGPWWAGRCPSTSDRPQWSRTPHCHEQPGR